MVYAQADKRWGGADLTVVSLELLTVFGAGPLAAYICYGIQRRDYRVMFWMIVLATAELYGGMSDRYSRAKVVGLTLLCVYRLHDILPRMVNWQPKSRC
jgi:EXPERA (EXPanded EBP superfamily)